MPRCTPPTGFMDSCRRRPPSFCLARWRLLTLAAALLHGPALAGLGVVGAYLAPLLVASTKPDFWSLYIYIAVVTAAAFALARLRLWPWLAHHGDRARRAVDAPGNWCRHRRRAWRPRVPRARRLRARRDVARVRLALWSAGFARRGSTRLSTLALSVYLLVASILVLASRHDRCRAHGLCRPHRRDRRHRLAHRGRGRRRAGGRDPRRGGDGALGGAHECPRVAGAVRPDGARDTGARALRLRIASPPCRRRGRRCSASPAFWRKAAPSRAFVPMLWCAAARIRAARHAGRALLSHCGSSTDRCRSRRSRCSSPRSMRSRPRRWCGASRGPASWRRARCSRPARSPRWRWRSPSRWRRAGSPSGLR